MERTFICIKPESVQRCLVGRIIERFEANGFRLLSMKMIRASKRQATEHYIEYKDMPFFPKLISYMTSGAVVCMVFEGEDVVRKGRKLLGANPERIPLPGTIRGDFRNNRDVGKYHDTVCHGSDSVEDAQREIGIWFSREELPPPTRVQG